LEYDAVPVSTELLRSRVPELLRKPRSTTSP
jgi:hypothetical protein